MKYFWFSFLLICFVIASQSSFGQKNLIKEFKPGKIENVSVDRLGNLFLIFSNGSIKKYDLNGKMLAKLRGTRVPTLLEPWFHPRIFLYSRDDQKYFYYDHNFSLIEENKIDPAVAVSPFLICPTNDNKLLVLDKGDWSIKKIVSSTNQVLFEFNIDTTKFETKPQFTHVQEYQNLIFLLDRNSGIYIYNNLGKEVNHIVCKVENFGFFGEELYFLQKDAIVFYDLFTEKNHELKLSSGRFIIVTDERIILIKEDGRVFIYGYQPEVDK